GRAGCGKDCRNHRGRAVLAHLPSEGAVACRLGGITQRSPLCHLLSALRNDERADRLSHRELLRWRGVRRYRILLLWACIMRLRTLSDPDHLPALDRAFAIRRPGSSLGDDISPPRILLLYGSLRARSFSRLAVEEAARLLQFFGAETRIFNPADLPFPDQVASDDHPAVHELRELSLWSEGQVWCSPERHGAITGLM